MTNAAGDRRPEKGVVVHVHPGSAARAILVRACVIACGAMVVGAVCGPAPVRAAELPSAGDVASPALTLSAARSSITAGRTTTLTAQLGVPGAVLTVSRGTGPAVYSLVQTVVTDVVGAASWTVSPRRTATYRVEFAGDAVWSAASAETTVSVRPRLSMTATSSVYQGWKVAFTAQVEPAHPGSAIDVQRRVDGVWTRWRTVTLNDESRVFFRWVSDERGYVRFRLAMTADADHVAGAGPEEVVLVKDPNPYGVSRREAHFVVVDKSQYKLYYHEYGRVVRVFDCVLGKPSTPTPQGGFRIYAKDDWVGGPYGPRRMRYLGAYAIHGTNEPWLLTRFPRAYSHGCTRLANKNVLWLYARVHVGTRIWNVP